MTPGVEQSEPELDSRLARKAALEGDRGKLGREYSR